MSVSDAFVPQVPLWDPQNGDLTRQHGLYQTQLPSSETPQELVSAGWTPCPRCGQFWLSPENKAQVEAHGGYFTCPKCKLTSDLLSHLPWHGVEEPDYYPKQGTGGGTRIGLPMEDVGQIAENIVRQMGAIPGYGAITWWHPGTAGSASPLDGATAEWGIEVKGAVYDAAGHFWDPGRDAIEGEVTKKNQAAATMGLQGILGILVVENFRTDTADVYTKPMPLTPWVNPQGRMMPGGIAKWHKRTGEKVASGIPFPNPYKDPSNPAPGPYSLADHYQKPQPVNEPATTTPAEDMPF